MRTVLAFALTLLTIAALALPSTADTVVTRGESDRIFLRWTPPAEGTDCGDDRYRQLVGERWHLHDGCCCSEVGVAD